MATSRLAGRPRSAMVRFLGGNHGTYLPRSKHPRSSRSDRAIPPAHRGPSRSCAAWAAGRLPDGQVCPTPMRALPTGERSEDQGRPQHTNEGRVGKTSAVRSDVGRQLRLSAAKSARLSVPQRNGSIVPRRYILFAVFLTGCNARRLTRNGGAFCYTDLQRCFGSARLAVLLPGGVLCVS
jgi:hypothetical protein